MKKNFAKVAYQIDTGFETALDRYFHELDGEVPNNLHEMVVCRAERVLFASVMAHAQGNQTLAAKMLGLSRTTLRNKLTAYKMM